MENLFHKAGKMSVEFNCKPQRFLKSGELSVKLQASGALYNPTFQDSLPRLVIDVSGSGSVTIGSYAITIGDISSQTQLVIDSELQDVYELEAKTNLNDKVSFSSGLFPKLEAGLNSISFSGSISYVEVTPRWWIL